MTYKVIICILCHSLIWFKKCIKNIYCWKNCCGIRRKNTGSGDSNLSRPRWQRWAPQRLCFVFVRSTACFSYAFYVVLGTQSYFIHFTFCRALHSVQTLSSVSGIIVYLSSKCWQNYSVNAVMFFFLSKTIKTILSIISCICVWLFPRYWFVT